MRYFKKNVLFQVLTHKINTIKSWYSFNEYKNTKLYYAFYIALAPRTVYVNKHLSCHTYGRVPTKGCNYIGTYVLNSLYIYRISDGWGWIWFLSDELCVFYPKALIRFNPKPWEILFITYLNDVLLLFKLSYQLFKKNNTLNV